MTFAPPLAAGPNLPSESWAPHRSVRTSAGVGISRRGFLCGQLMVS